MSHEITLNADRTQVVIVFDGCTYHFTNDMNPMERMSRRERLVAMALLNDALQELEAHQP